MSVILAFLIFSTPELNKEMKQTVIESLCNEKQPKGRPAIYYKRENGKCVAKVRP
jgi:hypothetical protein